MHLIECLTAKLEVLELDIAGPNANIQLFGVEVPDIHAQEPV